MMYITHPVLELISMCYREEEGAIIWDTPQTCSIVATIFPASRAETLYHRCAIFSGIQAIEYCGEYSMDFYTHSHILSGICYETTVVIIQGSPYCHLSMCLFPSTVKFLCALLCKKTPETFQILCAF